MTYPRSGPTGRALSTGPKALWASVLCAALLAACGGGSDSTPTVTPIVAGNDTLTLGEGQTGQLLNNDTLGGTAATASTVTFSVTSGALPTGITTTAAGAVTVAVATVPGVVNLTYRICETASAANCANGTAAITVSAPAIVAATDTATLAAGASRDLLANDTIGGNAATAARVTVSAVSALPTGVTLSAAGVLSVGATAVAGTTAITYRVCQIVASTNCANGTANLTVPPIGGASIIGKAIDATTTAGVAGVRVTAGSASTTTDATGNFTLTGAPIGARVTLLFNSDTHTEGARIVATSASTATTDVQARLVRVGATVDVPVASGGAATLAGSPAQVVLPANAVQRADGSLPTGNVKVSITPINPAVDLATMPGDMSTVSGGATVPIESFGALGVQLRDAAGANLNLRAGQTSTIRIPLASRDAAAPSTIPLFYFDTTSGQWVQEGTATLAGTAPNRYYEGTVTHFSTWNADRVMETVRYTGCVVNSAGVRVGGVSLFSEGINYSGSSRAVADVNGNFTIPVRRSSTATLVGLSGNLLTNTLSLTTLAVDSTVTTCLTLGAAGSGVSMKLTWGLVPRDLDSHLLTPSGFEVYFGRSGDLVAAPFANLDVDDTGSYGPEVITISKLMVGTYKYFVHNYTGRASNSGEDRLGNSSARVELNVPNRATELYTVPTVGEDATTSYWLLFEMDVDSACNITVRRGNTLSATPPTAASATPVYCVRP